MKNMSIFKLIIRLLSFLGKNIILVLIATLNGTLGFLLSMTITIFAAIAIMSFLKLFSDIPLWVTIAVIICGGFARGFLRYFEQYFNHFLAFKIIALLRNKIFNALTKISINKLDNKNKAEIISIVQADVETLEIFYAHTISPFLIAILTCTTITLLIGFLVHWYVALIFVAAYLFIGILIPIIYQKFNQKFASNYRKKLGIFKSFFNQNIRARDQIITNNKINDQLMLANEQTNKMLVDYKKLDKNNNLFKNLTFLAITIINIVTVFIAFFISQKGVIVNMQLILIFITLTSSFGPVLALANLPQNLSMSFASARRVFEIVDEDNNEKQTVAPIDIENIEFKNVSFGYQKELVLKNINLQIKPKEIVGIYGESGVGKTTILKLILKFYPINEGNISINNENIDHFNIKTLLNEICLFSQQTYLFQDTIYNNLLMANENATKQEIIDVCKKVNIYDFIINTKDGFNTKINDFVDNLSEGEKQMIGLARVLLKKPKILLLDEATSNIDALNESFILQTIKKEAKRCGILIISHRKSTLAICNKIYKLQNQTLHRMK